jgi:HD-GYP domain-containing protein (c-di-GMP phosphodiesterase class II)
MEALSAVLVLAGAAIMLFSLMLGMKVRSSVPGEARGRWLAAVSLMAFFLLSYLFFVFILLGDVSFPLELVTGSVFLAGALFVYVVINLAWTSIRRVSEKDRDLEEYAGRLASRTAELEQEAAERIRAEEQAGVRLQNLAVLHEIDMVIGSSLDLRVILKAFLERSVSHLRVDAACVLLLDPNTQILGYAEGVGFRGGGIERTSLRLGEGSPGRAAIERRTVDVPDIGKSEKPFDRAELLEEEDFAAYYAVPLIAKGKVQGVLEVFHRSPLEPGREWLYFLEALALQAAIAIDNITLFNDLQLSNAELVLAYDTTLEGWARALELRDKETEGHTQRVVGTTLRVARAMGMHEKQLVHVRRGALLHDIGKMSIPDGILFKEGPLAEDEWEVMRRHPSYAFELLLPISYLRPALDIPYCHHEKWDGTGYPRGLKGEQIPLAARIFAVVDAWDALHNERRYHEAWSVDKVCEHIQSLAGTHFDPAVVEVFMRLGCGEHGPESGS